MSRYTHAHSASTSSHPVSLHSVYDIPSTPFEDQDTVPTPRVDMSPTHTSHPRDSFPTVPPTTTPRTSNLTTYTTTATAPSNPRSSAATTYHPVPIPALCLQQPPEPLLSEYLHRLTTPCTHHLSNAFRPSLPHPTSPLAFHRDLDFSVCPHPRPPLTPSHNADIAGIPRAPERAQPMRSKPWAGLPSGPRDTKNGWFLPGKVGGGFGGRVKDGRIKGRKRYLPRRMMRYGVPEEEVEDDTVFRTMEGEAEMEKAAMKEANELIAQEEAAGRRRRTTTTKSSTGSQGNGWSKVKEVFRRRKDTF